MQGHDRGEAQLTHLAEQSQLGTDVQVVGRLVEQQQARTLCQRARDLHALLLSTAERVPEPLREVARPDHSQRFLGHASVLLAAEAAEHARTVRDAPEQDDLSHRQVDAWRRILFKQGNPPGRLTP